MTVLKSLTTSFIKLKHVLSHEIISMNLNFYILSNVSRNIQPHGIIRKICLYLVVMDKAHKLRIMRNCFNISCRIIYAIITDNIKTEFIDIFRMLWVNSFYKNVSAINTKSLSCQSSILCKITINAMKYPC